MKLAFNGLDCLCEGDDFVDADLMKVYKRLAAHHELFEIIKNTPIQLAKKRDFNFPDLCTAEMTTFLKETTNGTAT